MKENINGRLKKVLELAENEMMDLNHPYVGTEHLLLALLLSKKSKKVLNKYGLTYELFKQELINIIGKSNIKSQYVLYTPLLKLILNKTLQVKDADELTLLKELLASDDGIAIRIMLELEINVDDLYSEVMNNYSYLDEVGINLNRLEDNYELIGRESEIESIIEILLRKNKNNPVLVGEAGVGKSAIVYELAKRIKEGNVPPSLQNKTIYMLDMASLLSNTKYRGEFETKMNNILHEIQESEDIIVFIDEIHTIVRTGSSEGSCDAANILKPYLATNKLKLIGATTLKEYDEYISKDQALARRFAKILVKEPNERETLEILKGVKHTYEEYHNLKISDEILSDIVSYATKYITNNQNPDKSLEVLDCLLSHVNLKRYNKNDIYKLNEFLRSKDYKKALEEKIKMNDVEITKEDLIKVVETLANVRILNMQDYYNLCKELEGKIYGQDLTKLKELLLPKFKNNKVLALELCGNKGVGKSYTAKVIAEALNYNLIELDMKEYSSSTSINRLIGSDPGYIGYDNASILDKIKYNPYSLLLLKNCEYAHSSVMNLINSIVDKGYLIDKFNNKINFNFTMIIKTNNETKNKIGYDELTKQDSKIVYYNLIDKKTMKKYLIDHNLKEEYLANLEDKTTFSNLHSLVDEVLINN